jgi:hypothetical protein
MVPLSFVVVVVDVELAGVSSSKLKDWWLGFMQGTIEDTSLLANAISYIASASGNFLTG